MSRHLVSSWRCSKGECLHVLFFSFFSLLFFQVHLLRLSYTMLSRIEEDSESNRASEIS
jgi:hypothetical protein